MNCADARELLSAFVDDALEAAEAAEVGAHLDACEACRAHLAEIETVVGLVREIPEPVVPDGFAAEILTRLPAKRVPTAIKWLAPLAAAACLLLVAKLGFDSDRAGAPLEVAETSGRAEVVLDRGVVAKEEGDAVSAAGPEMTNERSGYYEEKRAPGKMLPTGARLAEELGAKPADAPVPDPASAPEPEAAPAKPVAKSGSSGPSSPVPVRSQDDGVDGREYAVQGAEPDTAAGVILAELSRKRSREPQGDKPAGEKVVQGRGGEVSGMLLYLTPGELEFVTCLLEERPGVRLARMNGPGKKMDSTREAKAESDAEDGDDAAAKRLRVELRFR